MFSDEIVSSIVKENKVHKESFEKLLNIYVSPRDDWWDHVVTLRNRLINKFGEVEGNRLTKQHVAFTILIPAYDRNLKIDHQSPQRLLLGSDKFTQFTERDWFEELKNVVLKDQRIALNRKEVIQLGFIDQIQFQPFSRQAFKWLCDKAEETNELSEDTKDKFKKLVMVYGGALITYMFTNHSKLLGKVPNWRTAYFVEHAIYDAYSLEQILKIKQAELKKTNPQFVRAQAN